MTEPAPDPAPTPAQAVVRRIHWPRARTYFWSILLALSLWIGGTLITIRMHPERFVRLALAQLPFPASIEKVYWVNARTLQMDEVRFGDFFNADSIIVTASPFGLWRRHVAKVQVIGPSLFTEPLYAALDKIPAGSDDAGIDLTIGRLEVSRGTLLLNNIIANTSIPVSLGPRRPIVIQNLKLGKPDNSPDMVKERVVEIGSVRITSPVDPFASVFNFPLTRVRFTYAELWQHHVREIDLVRPTMYLGEDLFAFAKEMEAESKKPAVAGPDAPWDISHFEIQYGQLAINALGQPVAHLPFFIQTQVDNIRLDQLDQISAKSAVVIQRLDRDYPDYKVHIANLHGQLYFSWPPSDREANNVVSWVKVDEVAWNDIPVKDVYCTVTFDPMGVYGKLGGTCEGGQLTGNFEFYYSKGYNWNVDLFADKVDVKPIMAKLAGKDVSLTGHLDGKLAVQGMVTEILNCQGALTLPAPGVLDIKSLDSMLRKLPGQLSLRDQAVNLAVESFRTYPYQNGLLKIDYKPTGGTGSLLLNSSYGKRQFDLYWHPQPETSSRVANDADNR